MGPTLSMAAQLGAYTLTDIGTFLAYRRATSTWRRWSPRARPC